MRLPNFQNYLFAHEQWRSSGSREKLSQSSFLWIVKSENHVLLFYLTENWNLIPHMATLFLLVLRHRKWKPCFSLFCATKNGNSVSPCLAPQKMETLVLLVCVTENGNPVSPCIASQKNSLSYFLEGFVWLFVLHVASYSFFLRKRLKETLPVPNHLF